MCYGQKYIEFLTSDFALRNFTIKKINVRNQFHNKRLIRNSDTVYKCMHEILCILFRQLHTRLLFWTVSIVVFKRGHCLKYVVFILMHLTPWGIFS